MKSSHTLVVSGSSVLAFKEENYVFKEQFADKRLKLINEKTVSRGQNFQKRV